MTAGDCCPNYSNQELYDILEYIDKKEIFVEFKFTLAMPGEKEEYIKDLKNFRKKLLKSLKNVKSGVVLTSQIDPGSFWSLRPERFGIETSQKTFLNFYNFNKRSDISYYTHLGYYIPGYYTDLNINNQTTFRKEIQKIRCKYFCLLSGTSTWLGANLVGRLKCTILNLFWQLKIKKVSYVIK